VEKFVSRHADAVIGTLCGFDRLVFRGTLRLLAHRGGMMNYLGSVKVLLKDFGEHALALSGRLKDASTALARRSGRPIRYLASSATNKEDVARQIARADRIEQGLVCIVSAVEPCLTYDVVRDREARVLDLKPRRRQCLYLYHYQIHPLFGFMHARIQTWFPFAIQVCLNGREWLARTMDQADMGYMRRDNGFVWLEDPVAGPRGLPPVVAPTGPLKPLAPADIDSIGGGPIATQQRVVIAEIVGVVARQQDQFQRQQQGDQHAAYTRPPIGVDPGPASV